MRRYPGLNHENISTLYPAELRALVDQLRREQRDREKAARQMRGRRRG